VSQAGNAEDPAVEPLRPIVKPKKSGAWLNILLGVAALAAVGGLAFAAGRMTAPATAAFPNVGPGSGQLPGGGNFQGGPGASFQPGAGPGGGFLGNGGVTLEGTVEAKDADSITIKLTNGQTVEVSLASDTSYHTQTPASGDSVQSGSTVRVQVDIQGQGQGQGQGQFSASDVTVVP
jgi:hypothetical protein